jgi:hypothetical protein
MVKSDTKTGAKTDSKSDAKANQNRNFPRTSSPDARMGNDNKRT